MKILYTIGALVAIAIVAIGLASLSGDKSVSEIFAQPEASLQDEYVDNTGDVVGGLPQKSVVVEGGSPMSDETLPRAEDRAGGTYAVFSDGEAVKISEKPMSQSGRVGRLVSDVNFSDDENLIYFAERQEPGFGYYGRIFERDTAQVHELEFVNDVDIMDTLLSNSADFDLRLVSAYFTRWSPDGTIRYKVENRLTPDFPASIVVVQYKSVAPETPWILTPIR